ncbi:acyltransferase [Lacrimispora saccharolytica]|nr:acyltransferase [Lacrimispora saccharolytica]
MVKKNLQIEYIRAIAAVAVVAIHTVNSGIIYKGSTYSEGVIIFFLAIKNLLYWAVPCFGMISGMLILNPEKDLSPKKIYGKYFLRMAIVLLLFGTAFSWIEIFFGEKKLDLSQITRAMGLVLSNKTWAHLWYIYALLTVYLILPIYRWISSKKDDFWLVGSAILIFILMTALKSRTLSLHLYFLLGEIFRRRIVKLSGRQSRIIAITSSCLIVLCVYLQSVVSSSLSFLFGYTSILTVIQSFAIFDILYTVNYEKIFRKGNRILQEISSKSFGIYLTHMVFVNAEYQGLHLHLMNSYVSIAIFMFLIVLNLALAYCVSSIIARIPMLNKLV